LHIKERLKISLVKSDEIGREAKAKQNVCILLFSGLMHTLLWLGYWL